MDSPKTDGLALRDYVAVLRRRLWVIVVVVLVATLSAYGLSWLHTPQYEASTELLYEQQINVADPLTGGSSLDTNALSLEVDNMGTLVTSPEVRAIAVQLAPSLAGAHYGVTAVPKTDTSQSSTTVAVSGATAHDLAELAGDTLGVLGRQRLGAERFQHGIVFLDAKREFL